MYIDYQDMPRTARIWIYQSDRILSAGDERTIADMASVFLHDWTAHGQSLKTSFKLFHHKFLVIAVDEKHNLASGCSIDASVSLIKDLAQKLSIDFFDRTKVCFLVNNEIFESSMSGIKQLVDLGKISADTLTFNNLVADIEGLDNDWLVPANESWLKRYFT